MANGGGRLVVAGERFDLAVVLGAAAVLGDVVEDALREVWRLKERAAAAREEFNMVVNGTRKEERPIAPCLGVVCSK